MSDSSDEDKSGSGSGSGNDDSGSDDNESGSGSDNDSGSGSGSGSGSDSGSGSGSGSDSDSSSGKKKKKGKKGKENAIDDMEDFKPKVPSFFNLLADMRSILMDMKVVERQVQSIEMRFNPKPYVAPLPPVRPPSPPRRRSPSPPRNYFPPGYSGNQQVHFDEEQLRQSGSPPPNAIVIQPSYGMEESEYGGSASHLSYGAGSQMGQYPSQAQLSNYAPMQQQNPPAIVVMQPGALPYNQNNMAMMPRQPHQIQQHLPKNFGTTGPYTKYLKGGQANNPEPMYTNRFFQHQPNSQVKPPTTSRFANGRSPAQNQQPYQAAQAQAFAQSQRPPMQSNRMMQQAPGFHLANTMQDHTMVPQAAVDMMHLQNQQYNAQADSEQETDRQQYAYDVQQDTRKKMAGPPPGVGTAQDRVKLGQIENAIDQLLAQ